MKVTFWGVRGSLPVPGALTWRTGGNTACVELRSNEGDLIILDAGTGIRALGQALTTPEIPRRVVATILVSHRHSDHVQGLPFFAPARMRGNRFVVIGQQGMTGMLEQVMSGDTADVYFPGIHTGSRADVLVKELREGEPIVVGRSVVVRARRVEDPQGGMGYRVSADGHTVAYVTDLRHPEGGLDPQVVELARDADLLIHDAQLTPEERRRYPDWVHSSWEEAVRVAQQAGARRLALFHHAPDAPDDDLERIERAARGYYANAFLAQEGLEIDLANSAQAAAALQEDQDSDDKLALRQAARRIMQKLREEQAGG